MGFLLLYPQQVISTRLDHALKRNSAPVVRTNTATLSVFEPSGIPLASVAHPAPVRSSLETCASNRVTAALSLLSGNTAPAARIRAQTARNVAPCTTLNTASISTAALARNVLGARSAFPTISAIAALRGSKRGCDEAASGICGASVAARLAWVAKMYNLTDRLR